MEIQKSIDISNFNCNCFNDSQKYIKLFKIIKEFKNILYNKNFYKNKYGSIFYFINFLKVVLDTDDIDKESLKYRLIKEFKESFDVEHFLNISLYIKETINKKSFNHICENFDVHINRVAYDFKPYNNLFDCDNPAHEVCMYINIIKCCAYCII